MGGVGDSVSRVLTEEERETLQQLADRDDLESAEWARRLLEADDGGERA